VRLGRGEAGLLDAVELAEADRWLAQETAPDVGYSAHLVDLVDRSRAALDNAEAERRAMQERELAQVRALADEQEQRAEAEKQRAEMQARSARALGRRSRVLVIALGLALVAAAVAAFFVRQTDVARKDAENSAANARAAADARATRNRAYIRSTFRAVKSC
jgi:hypothetical protein